MTSFVFICRLHQYISSKISLPVQMPLGSLVPGYEIRRIIVQQHESILNDLHEIPSLRTRRQDSQTNHRSSNPTIPEACKPSVTGVVAPEDAGSIGTLEMG